MTMTIAPAQVDREATELPIEEIATFLQDHLGQRITAYIAGVSDREMVGRWISGRHTPRPLATFRLRAVPTRRPACSQTPTTTTRQRRGCLGRTRGSMTAHPPNYTSDYTGRPSV
jgi:hypothetical protein